MPRHLIACGCGNSVPVDAGQAGGQVVCRCGAKLDVPALRNLRQLPMASAASATSVGARRAWRPRYGIVALLLIVAAALALSCLWIYLTEPRPPAFDSARVEQSLTEQIDDLTPAHAWRWLILNQEQLGEGFVVYPFHLSHADQEKLAQKKFIEKALLVVAGVFAAAGLTAALWPETKPRKTA